MSVSSAFNRLHTLAGSPTMTCIRPRAQWTSGVPDGYSFDADYDGFLNDSGTPWSPTINDLGDLPRDSVNILPGGGQSALDLETGGIVATGDRYVRILAADYDTVNDAFCILLDDNAYDVVEMTPWPAGSAQWYVGQLKVRL